LLLHRHHWVRLRTQVQNALQAIALANGLRRGPGLWSYDGQAKIELHTLLVREPNRPWRTRFSCRYERAEVNLSVRPFSGTIRTTLSGTPEGMVAWISSVTFTMNATIDESVARKLVTENAGRFPLLVISSNGMQGFVVLLSVRGGSGINMEC
jgi:hypothetical protein